ncbi:alpha/beta fold hydrolase [Roseateles sp. BYS180W]|uniref:Alpha/beta fold hydrolase n=1 Tax=Roseateles rivi TaxID=3299028 RepID=A0ABW7FVL7_9BURK
MTEPRLNTVQCLHPQGLHRMAYWEWGEADNPQVVVCAHGLTRQGRDFDTLAQRLAQRFRVVCPDVVGRGQSDWLDNPMLYQVPQYVSDMVALLARLQARELSWVGTSMGGLIGLGLAALPGSPVQRLVLNDVGPRLELSSLQRIGAYVGKAPGFDSLEQGAAYLRSISPGFGEHTPEQWLALSRPMFKPAQQGLRLHYDPRISEPWAALTPEWVQAGEAQLWAAYDALRIPVLVLRGQQSDLLSAETAQAMASRGPQAQVVELPDVGHAPTLVHAEQMAWVENFL